MIAVAALGGAFALFGVNPRVALALTAFTLSALCTRPAESRSWLVLVIATMGGLPYFGLAFLYAFGLRAALFLGHWPTYNFLDPTSLPARFDPLYRISRLADPDRRPRCWRRRRSSRSSMRLSTWRQRAHSKRPWELHSCSGASPISFWALISPACCELDRGLAPSDRAHHFGQPSTVSPRAGLSQRTTAETRITATHTSSMTVSPILSQPRTTAPALIMFQNLPVIS